MPSFIDRCIDKYLDSTDGYYGNSDFNVKEEVKLRACTPNNPRERLFDVKRKLWGTKSLYGVRRLMESGLWYPVGIDTSWKTQFIDELNRRLSGLAEIASAKAEEKSNKLRNDYVAQAAYDKDGNKVLNAEERHQLQKERDRGMIDSSPRELQLLWDTGFTPALLAAIPPLYDSIKGLGPVLGPSAGISPAGKVLRMIQHRHTAVRHLYSDTRDENGKQLYFDSAFLEEQYKANDKQLIEHLQMLMDKHAGTVPADVEQDAKASHKKANMQQQQSDATTEDVADYHSCRMLGVTRQLPTPEALSEQTKPKQTAPGTLGKVKVDYKRAMMTSVKCRKCKTTVHEQFLECSCCTLHAAQWERCDVCQRFVNRHLQPCNHVRVEQLTTSTKCTPKAPVGYSLPGLEKVSADLQATAIDDSGAVFVEDVLKRVEKQLDASAPRLVDELDHSSGTAGHANPSKRRASVAAQAEAIKRHAS